MKNKEYNEKTIDAYKINKTNFSDMAETVIKNNNRNRITSSQLRPILARINDIAKNISSKDREFDDDILYKLQYLRMTIAYASGRETSVKNFIEKSDVFGFIERIQKTKNKEDLVLLGKYFEALVAFHKFYGGE